MDIESRHGRKSLMARVLTWLYLRSTLEKFLMIVSVLILSYLFFTTVLFPVEIEPCPELPLQVFVLAGQANMMGYAKSNTLHVFDGKEPYASDLWDTETGMRVKGTLCVKLTLVGCIFLALLQVSVPLHKLSFFKQVPSEHTQSK